MPFGGVACLRAPAQKKPKPVLMYAGCNYWDCACWHGCWRLAKLGSCCFSGRPCPLQQDVLPFREAGTALGTSWCVRFFLLSLSLSLSLFVCLPVCLPPSVSPPVSLVFHSSSISISVSFYLCGSFALPTLSVASNVSRMEAALLEEECSIGAYRFDRHSQIH